MSAKRIHKEDFAACKMLILEIQALVSRAHRLGMIQTAHSLNSARNEAGWELVEHIPTYVSNGEERG